MIKLLTGWSNPGGSTVALIRLTNTLNVLGFPAALYGPHEWHLSKCPGELLCHYSSNHDDRLIVHFLGYQQRPDAARVLLACHEKELYSVAEQNQFWDECIFLNHKHRRYHGMYTGAFRIIPNLKEELAQVCKNPGALKTVGVIGSIDRNKQTHISIKKALNDGFDQVLLFGQVTDYEYYHQEVAPLIREYPGVVVEYGYFENKSVMYSMVGTVYLSSVSEVAPLVKDECSTTGTPFVGSGACDADALDMANEAIIQAWINALELA